MEQKEQKKSEQKTAQVLYMTVILVLCIMAVAVGLTTAAGKRNKPAETVPSTKTTTQTVQTTARLPVITSPVRPNIGTTAPASTTAPAGTTQTARSAAEADAPVPSLPVFIMPTIGNVSKGYTVEALVWSNTMEDYRTHDGIDICAGVGEGVMAAADGIVTEVFAHPMMGTTVVVRHDGDAESIYQNLAADVAVSVGDTVKSGEVLGAVGDSALIEVAEEPHLHFALRVGGESVNPLDYISAATMTIVYDE